MRWRGGDAPPAPGRRGPGPGDVVVARTAGELTAALGRRPGAAALGALHTFTAWSWLVLAAALATRRPSRALLLAVTAVLAFGGWYLTRVHPRALTVWLPPTAVDGRADAPTASAVRLEGDALRGADAVLHWLPLALVLAWCAVAGPGGPPGVRAEGAAAAAAVLGLLGCYWVTVDPTAVYGLRARDVAVLALTLAGGLGAAVVLLPAAAAEKN